jgi:tetratricopeptide (TPR) repeat protein
LRNALTLDPHFDKAEFMIGAINAMQSRLDDAKVNPEKALQMSPRNPYYLFQYGILLGRLGDQAAALSQMKLAEKLDPSYARTYFSVGALDAQMGSYKEMRLQLEGGLRRDPGFPGVYYVLGHVCHELVLEAKSQEAFDQFQQMKAQAQAKNKLVGPSVPSDESLPALTLP